MEEKYCPGNWWTPIKWNDNSFIESTPWLFFRSQAAAWPRNVGNVVQQQADIDDDSEDDDDSDDDDDSEDDDDNNHDNDNNDDDSDNIKDSNSDNDDGDDDGLPL